MTVKENKNAGYLPGSVTYRRTLKVRLIYPGKHQAIKSVQVFSVSKEKSSSVRIELVDNKKNNSPIEGSLDIFNGRIKGISGWHWDNSDKKTGVQSFRLNLNGKPKGIIAEVYSSAKSLPGSNDETVITFRSPLRTFSVSLKDIEKGPVYIPYFNAYLTRSSDIAPFSKNRG